MIARDLNRHTDPSDKILDVGTKHGDKVAEVDAEVVGLDVALKPKHEQLQYILGDGFRMPFKSGSFDFVVCSQVLEHVPNTDKLISEISRVLDPKGTFLVDFPNRLFPDRPHSPPGFYSLLPRPVALRLAPHLLPRETANYYKENVYNLSPIKARKSLHSHFEVVKYVTIQQKERYRQVFLGKEYSPHYTPNLSGKMFAKFLPVISVLTAIKPINWLFELCYPHAAYECQLPKREEHS